MCDASKKQDWGGWERLAKMIIGNGVMTETRPVVNGLQQNLLFKMFNYNEYSKNPVYIQVVPESQRYHPDRPSRRWVGS